LNAHYQDNQDDLKKDRGQGYDKMIPSVEECFELMERYEMLDNIKAHSIVVEKIAGVIAKGLIESGEEISMEKVTAGALMHDIGKTMCLNSNNDHADKGREICLQNNLDEIAEIVKEHIVLNSYEPDGAICEKEIIYYADKRVNHDVVVSLEKRLEYLLERYAKGHENLARLIRINFDKCKDVEKKLFGSLNFKPNDLTGMI